MRQLYDMRRPEASLLTGREMQHVVKSQHGHGQGRAHGIAGAADRGGPQTAPRGDFVRVFLSGHLCHAPKPGVLDLVEQCGAIVVDDDLYTASASSSRTWTRSSRRSTRWRPGISPATGGALPDTGGEEFDWEEYLLKAVGRAGAQGLIILQAKFCEPHMYFYPEIKEAFDRNGIPNLLIETEHEEMPLEALKTRVETFMEITKRKAAA